MQCEEVCCTKALDGARVRTLYVCVCEKRHRSRASRSAHRQRTKKKTKKICWKSRFTTINANVVIKNKKFFPESHLRPYGCGAAYLRIYCSVHRTNAADDDDDDDDDDNDCNDNDNNKPTRVHGQFTAYAD